MKVLYIVIFLFLAYDIFYVLLCDILILFLSILYYDVIECIVLYFF